MKIGRVHHTNLSPSLTEDRGALHSCRIVDEEMTAHAQYPQAESALRGQR